MYREKNKEYRKEWNEKNKDKNKEYQKKYYENNHDKALERSRKYRKDNHDKELERNRKYREKNYDFYMLGKHVSKFYKKYFRYFSSIKNYLTIMKLGDDSLKQSIMIKLGKGTILEDEAVALSGMVWTDDDQKELNEWWNIRRCKSSLWRKDLYIHNH